MDYARWLIPEHRTLASLASDTVSEVKTTANLLRSGQNQQMSPEATEKLFALKSGEYAIHENAAKNGIQIFTVSVVTPADKVAEQENVDRMNQQLTSSIQQDIISQYRGYLEKEIGVSVKDNLIREYF